MDDEAAQAFADSIAVEPWPPLQDVLEAAQEGMVVCYRLPDGGWEFTAVVRPDLDPRDRQGFGEWARQRAYLLALTDDIDADGWFKRSDGGWQITARRVDLPPDPFSD